MWYDKVVRSESVVWLFVVVVFITSELCLRLLSVAIWIHAVMNEGNNAQSTVLFSGQTAVTVDAFGKVRVMLSCVPLDSESKVVITRLENRTVRLPTVGHVSRLTSEVEDCKLECGPMPNVMAALPS